MQYHHLALSGALTIGKGDVILRGEVEQALERGYSVLIVDLSNVTYMDSAAVGQLAHSYKTVTAQGGILALTSLRPKIRKLLQTMSFLNIFPVFDSLEDAVQILEMKMKHAHEAQMQCQAVAV